MVIISDSDIAFLREHGYVVVPSVMTDEECDAVRDMLEEETMTAYGLKSRKELRDKLDYIMWRNQKVANLQGRAVWTVRTHPKVEELYQQIWFGLLNIDGAIPLHPEISAHGDIELTTSLDGFMLSNDTAYKSSGKFWTKGKKGWLHSDQCKNHAVPPECRDATEACVQGQLLLQDADDKNAGFACLRGSHKHWAEACALFGDSLPDKSYWNPLTDAMFNWYTQEKGCEHVKIACPKGGMILWFSCLMHSGSEASRAAAPVTVDAAGQKLYRGRAMVFCSQTPKFFSSGKNWSLRSRAFYENYGTNHWTYGEGMTLNGRTPMGPKFKSMLRPDHTVVPPFSFDAEQQQELHERQQRLLFG